MGKHLRKVQAKLNARIKSATLSKEERSKSRGGGGYADPKNAVGYHRPGSMKSNS